MAYMMLLSAVDAARAALRGLLARLHVDERGQDTAEYLVMTGVVVAILIGVIWAAYSGALQGLVDKVSDAIDAITF
jgi:Flp pilus assembly pilin Flp